MKDCGGGGIFFPLLDKEREFLFDDLLFWCSTV